MHIVKDYQDPSISSLPDSFLPNTMHWLKGGYTVERGHAIIRAAMKEKEKGRTAKYKRSAKGKATAAKWRALHPRKI
ncbi:hypothetical protein HJFPF1_02739 [Paramyrothecium foliicola]|nr:hypothetical protein HJFPF1_02739 [Paramyrothecium foliicola]